MLVFKEEGGTCGGLVACFVVVFGEILLQPESKVLLHFQNFSALHKLISIVHVNHRHEGNHGWCKNLFLSVLFGPTHVQIILVLFIWYLVLKIIPTEVLIKTN